MTFVIGDIVAPKSPIGTYSRIRAYRIVVSPEEHPYYSIGVRRVEEEFRRRCLNERYAILRDTRSYSSAVANDYEKVGLVQDVPGLRELMMQERELFERNFRKRLLEIHDPGFKNTIERMHQTMLMEFDKEMANFLSLVGKYQT